MSAFKSLLLVHEFNLLMCYIHYYLCITNLYYKEDQSPREPTIKKLIRDNPLIPEFELQDRNDVENSIHLILESPTKENWLNLYDLVVCGLTKHITDDEINKLAEIFLLQLSQDQSACKESLQLFSFMLSKNKMLINDSLALSFLPIITDSLLKSSNAHIIYDLISIIDTLVIHLPQKELLYLFRCIQTSINNAGFIDSFPYSSFFLCIGSIFTRCELLEEQDFEFMIRFSFQQMKTLNFNILYSIFDYFYMILANYPNFAEIINTSEQFFEQLIKIDESCICVWKQIIRLLPFLILDNCSAELYIQINIFQHIENLIQMQNEALNEKAVSCYLISLEQCSSNSSYFLKTLLESSILSNIPLNMLNYKSKIALLKIIYYALNYQLDINFDDTHIQFVLDFIDSSDAEINLLILQILIMMKQKENILPPFDIDFDQFINSPNPQIVEKALFLNQLLQV